MDVLKYPNPLLSLTCHPLKRVDAELLAMIEEMFEIMYRAKGVGLAANQVGLPYRLFIMNPSGDMEKKEQECVFINPEVTLGSGKPIKDEEGCLSFPKIYAEVLRAPKVTVRAYDHKGNEIHERYEGFAARIIQHEYDHLDGVSFIEHIEEEDVEDIELEADLGELEKTFKQQRAAGEVPPEDEMRKRWDELRKQRT